MNFVTGGTGLLGSHVIFHLLEKGESVVALRREGADMLMFDQLIKTYGLSDRTHLLQWVLGDVLDVACIYKSLKGVNVVYHCAAKVSFTASDYDEMMAVNIRGTENLVNASLENEVGKFCYVSSTAAIGDSKSDGLIDETCEWVQEDVSNYSVSKFYAEQEVWRGIQEGLNAVIVNPCIILGPGDWSRGSSTMFHTAWRGLKYYTEGQNAFVDVRDVASIMKALVDNDVKEERFLIVGENLKYKQVFDFIAAEFNIELAKVRVSKRMTALGWRMEKIWAKLTGKPPRVTKETARSAHSVRKYSNSKIKELLGIDFRSIEDSVRHACVVYKGLQK